MITYFWHISYEVTVAATVYILALYCNTQAFMQAPLFTDMFPQRFSFFSVYLVVETEEKSLNLSL